ncbi:restriction endonuclease subunit S [Vibrio sp. Vb0587]|uniref:restriction endonuclease subunit S n=1 Tax=Vibrio sp. Vb0587 TaxID=3074626 RepID=UPI0029652B8E|nr:restriction endonuclease subunit S [Vibrio sp. Vb0587]MDW1965986.1 restriction endonuclease subunit S [Vibrio sp. Vb0587]
MSNNKLRLKHLVSVHNGYGFPVEFQGDKGTIPFYKVSDMNTIGNEKYLVNSNNYVTEELCKSKNWKLVPAGSIILPKIGAALLTNKRRMTSQPCLIDNNCCALIPVDMNQGEWIYNSVLNIDSGDFCQSGAVPALKMGDFLLSEISLPNDRENLLITLESKLSLVDSSIGNLTQKLHHLEEYKTALIHNAVTKGLDANGVALVNNDDWKNVQFKEVILKIKEGGTPSTKVDEFWENGDIPWITAPDIDNGNIKVNKKITKKGYLSSSTHLWNKGDILFSSKGTVGKSALVNFSLVTNQNIMGMSLDKSKTDPKFVLYVLKLNSKEIQDKAKSTTMGAIYLEDILLQKINFPGLIDQITISKYIDDKEKILDKSKSIINKKIALLLEYKKSLINEAVSGKQKE